MMVCVLVLGRCWVEGSVGLKRWMCGGNGEVGGRDGVCWVREVVMEGRGGRCRCLYLLSGGDGGVSLFYKSFHSSVRV